MQQLYDAVRAAGAENLVIIGGLDWAYDSRACPANPIRATTSSTPRTPTTRRASPRNWNTSWGYLAATDPVIATEFGDSELLLLRSDWDSQLIAYADAQHMSWTAWAWFVGGCKFPSLITDWQGTPSPPGMLVQASLQTYSNDPAPGGKRPPPGP